MITITPEILEKLRTGTEADLREILMPWPRTREELNAVITAVVDREHDYGTCVYAMSIAAEATFNYVAMLLGTTGFQASCADLDIIRRTRSLKGPFTLVDGHDLLYPQYDIPVRLQETLAKWRPWASQEAKKLLAERTTDAHPDVLEHWARLASETP
jgi:hypothetical protein